MATLEELLAALGRLNVATARELARELEVAQPTVSRLIGEAGGRVCRMGRARTTRYARTRALPSLEVRSLPIYRISEAGKAEHFRELHLLSGGQHWLEAPDGTGVLFQGLPPFAADMSPQGYVGRTFSTRYPEVGLPPRISDWNDDHRLLALALRGEDCVGHLVIGRESLNRWYASPPEPVARTDYPKLARLAAEGQPGSSAGGEQPKFLASSEGRHVLVKFAGGDGEADRRWRELLVCESLALEEVRTAGIDVSTARWFDEQGLRFLEVERFDRLGSRGRRGVVSLLALDNEDFGLGRSWTRLSVKLEEAGRLGAEDARRIRWLDVFGQLTGNTDRHLGNLSFFETGGGSLRLAPLYDMLPMVFAPSGAMVVERRFEPAPPIAETSDVWSDAARHAECFWSRLEACAALGDAFRRTSSECRAALQSFRARVGP